MDDGIVGTAEWHNQTTINFVGLTSVLVLGTALVLLPRRFAIYPMVLLACFIPSAQRILILSADFDLLRILIVFGWIRLIVRNEFRGFAWNRLDGFLLVWMVSGTIVYTLNLGTFGAFVYRCGWMFDGLGLYFLFRCILRTWEDLERTFLCFVLASIPVSFAFLVEYMTQRNIFAFFGGVREFTWIRDGKLRCQGAFSHPVLAGSFWAVLLPFMMWFFVYRLRWLAGLAIGAALFIVFACGSSTPILSVAGVVVGFLVYRWRQHLREIRWVIVACICVLHLVMNKPVWHLIARIDLTGGSTGWHRFKILDATISNFSEWWLLGENDPMGWGVWEMRDITNQYILEGLRGGLLSLSFFICAIVVSFRIIGKMNKEFDQDGPKRLMVWSIGVGLFSHVVTFFGVSYFGQIIMLMYLNFAMVGSLSGLATTSSQSATKIAFSSTGHNIV